MKILENIEKENEMLKYKVEDVEKEKSEMKEDLKGFQKVTTLQEELYHLEKLGKSFECNICGLAFETKSELEVHVRKTRQIATWKSKLMETETENSQLKYRLSLDLFRMKELELKARESCSCWGFCHITHSKHNWTKSHCDEIFSQMENFNRGGVSVKKHQCQTSGQLFLNPRDFIQHIENNHKTADVIFLQN